jgi:beta-glucuronidase
MLNTKLETLPAKLCHSKRDPARYEIAWRENSKQTQSLKLKTQKESVLNFGFGTFDLFRISSLGFRVLVGLVLVLTFSIFCFAQERPLSSELIAKAREARDSNDIDTAVTILKQCIDLYKDQADKEQASLKAMPIGRPEIEAVPALNDVATAYFILGEIYRDQGKVEESIAAFKTVLTKYCFAQAWDPRGWFWSIARISRECIVKLNPNEPLPAPCPGTEIAIEKPAVKVSQLATKVALYDPGKEEFVDYAKYGEFKNIGTKDYQYVITDQPGLIAAVGEGIYPNTSSIRQDPEFKKALKEKRLDGSHWDFLQSPDLEAAFLKWATATEPQGIRMFYLGLILEKSGLIKHALKCYYAVVVHYPGTYGWTYWHTPWYVGQAAVAKINYLLRHNPQLGFKLVDADIRIINGFDNDVSNDIAVTNPGKFVKVNKLNIMEKLKPKPSADLLSIKRRLGKGKVHLIQYETGDWQLMVNNKPFVIKAVTYTPTKVGQSPDDGTLTDWMYDDFNNNGKIDGPYDAFVDKNRNNKQDLNERSVGDFRLMREMGVNAIRVYHHPQKINKELLRDLQKKYGIRVIMGDFLGKYAIGSGAPWNPGTDYNNEGQIKKMIESVTSMVREYKDEPFILFWLLGNENVYGYGCNADKEPEAFFAFANEAAKAIKAIDPDHPVAICNGDILYLDKFAKYCPDIDIFGANAYRGEYGFGRFWQSVKEEADKPAFITEYGCPAYAQGKDSLEAEQLQADYHRSAWEDMEYNMAFGLGAGNALGGIAFEYLDEWWKQYEPSMHDSKGVAMGPFPDGYFHEEWFGLNSQGNGSLSPFLRQPRKAYYIYKKMWNRK